MIISGLQKTTLLDYPGHVAATIFIGGCNFRCPFCHNLNIVDINNSDTVSQKYTKEEVISFLNKRSGVLDGVCITGGEPTLNKELPDFIREIKKLGSTKKLLVKLDTNGTNPEMIRYLLDEGLIDYVAMDIKSDEEGYGKVIGIDLADGKMRNDIPVLEKIKMSINYIITSDIDYEFRTTVVKQYHDEETIRGIGKLIKDAKKYFLQSFIDSEYVYNHELEAVDKETLNRFRDIMQEYVSEANIRGVD